MSEQSKPKSRAPLRGIKPVGKPRPISEVVYGYLKEAILRGDLTPGQRLVEHRLSLQMKTSRIPVREALKRLEQDDLVGKPDQRGFVVKDLTREEIEESFGIRAVLESYAAALATEHMDTVVVNRLERTLDGYRQALDRGDTSRLMQLNTQFDEIIYKAAGSRKLYALINNFRDFIFRYRQQLLTRMDFAAISLNDHTKMVEAMKKKDVEKVEKLMRTHIFRGRDIVMKGIEIEGER